MQADREALRSSELKDYYQKKYALASRVAVSPDDLDMRLALARLCSQHRDVEDARYYYRSLLARGANNETARRELASLDTSIALGDATTVQTAGAAVALPLAELLQKADALLARQEYDGAKQMYLTALGRDRKSALAYQGVGLTLAAQSKDDQAMLFLLYAARLNPALPPAQFLLACRYREAGFPEEAARRLSQIVAVKPDNSEYWHELGTAYGDGDSLKSEQALQRAVEGAPRSAPYRLDLAERQAENMHTQSAEQNFRLALSQEPDNSDALSRLGGFLLNTGSAAQRHEASDLLHRALNREPNNEYACYGLGRLALLEGDAKHAVSYLDRVVKQHPDIAEAWYTLSRVYQKLGDTTRAENAAAHSHELNQDYLDRLHTQELIRQHPSDAKLHLKLARLCARKSEFAKAILEYQISQRNDPRNEVVKKESDALIHRLKATNRMPSMPAFTQLVAEMTHA